MSQHEKLTSRDCLKYLYKINTAISDRIHRNKTTTGTPNLVQLKQDEHDLRVIKEIMSRLKEIDGLGGQKAVIEFAKKGAKNETLFQ